MGFLLTSRPPFDFQAFSCLPPPFVPLSLSLLLSGALGPTIIYLLDLLALGTKHVSLDMWTWLCLIQPVQEGDKVSGKRWRCVEGMAEEQDPGVWAVTEWPSCNDRRVQKAGRHNSNPWICCCRAVCLWASYIASLSVCPVGIMVLPGWLWLNRLSGVELAINYKPGLETGTEHPTPGFPGCGHWDVGDGA